MFRIQIHRNTILAQRVGSDVKCVALHSTDVHGNL